MFQRTFAATGSLWPRLNVQYVSGTTSALAALATLLEAFEGALRAVPGHQASAIRSRVRGASSTEELWPLRREVYELVSRSVEPWEAQARIRDLETVFERSRGR
jgi:hypothetical protein